MSTDKLQALHMTVAEIPSDPPAPPSYFDDEPHEAAQGRDQVAKASDSIRRGTEIPKENFGKAMFGKPAISPTEMREAHIVHAARNEIPGIARQALAERTPVAPPADAANQPRSGLWREAPGPRPDPPTTSIDTFVPTASGNRISRGSWVLRGIAGILLAAGIGAALIAWLGMSGDAAKTALTVLPQAAPPAQTAPTAATLPPELTPLLQSMARDLASMGKEIEQLKAGRELLVRDNAKFSEQFRASQEQLTSAVAQLSEQLKASQEQAARDNANVAAQIKGIQEQLTSVISRVAERNVPPRIAATPPRPTPLLPRPATTGVRQPVPALSSPQAGAQPRGEKPKSTSRPPAPARQP